MCWDVSKVCNNVFCNSVAKFPAMCCDSSDDQIPILLPLTVSCNKVLFIDQCWVYSHTIVGVLEGIVQ